MELVPVSIAEGLCLNTESILLIDAGSVSPLFEVLARFRISCPRAKIIVIGTDADETYIECVISAGAKGFIPATAPVDQFRHAIEGVRDGAIWAPRKVLSRLIGRRSNDRVPGASDGTAGVQLTPRENEVLKLLIGGQGNREIGAHLGIDPNTVKAHLGRMMRKAGVANRIELTMYALHRRSDDPPDRSAPGPGPTH
jgi:DNA-binding NarL/FixJ family response regulator